MRDEKPLSGGNYKSAFNEKFKLSEKFDPARSHEWSLHLTNQDIPFTIQSIKRGKETIRFWKKGDHSAGSGYIQLPVIFLSLKRLMPIGEDLKLKISTELNLTTEELSFFKEYHQRILMGNDNIQNTDYLKSPTKNTLGMNTDVYDWKQNSAGQDNIGKILLAILSFKRLKQKYPNEYKGGILAIDELDATIYPGSQLKLLEALRKFASKYDIQIIFTTHSLSILEQVCSLQKENHKSAQTKGQIKVIFLEKSDHNVEILSDVTYNTIMHRLKKGGLNAFYFCCN